MKIDRAGATYEPLLESISEKLTPAIIPMGLTSELGSREAGFQPFAADGPSDEVIQKYSNIAFVDQDRISWPEGFSNAGVHELKLKSLALLDKNGRPTTRFEYSEPLCFELNYTIYNSLSFCRIGFLVHALDGTPVFEIYDVDEDVKDGRREPGSYIVRCEVPGDLLKPGRYSLSLNAGMPGIKNLVRLEGVLQLTIDDPALPGAAMNLPRLGVIRPRAKWTSKMLHEN